MTMTIASGLGAALAATIVAVASPTAGPNRIWVSGKGADAAGCGIPAQPCRSFQYAHDAVVAGGEIDVLDPAGYGPVSVTKSISIVNDGVGLAGVQQMTAGGNGVYIGGSAGKVYLRGLTIDGANQGGSGVFIFPDTFATVTIENCVIKNFTSYGVWLDSTKFLIANSTIIDNQTGILARSYFSGVIKNSTVAGGTVGMSAGNTNYASSSFFTIINVFNTTFFNNSATGVYSEAAQTRLNLFDSSITANGVGLKTNIGAGVNLSRVEISSNQTGINTVGGGTVASYGDNVLSGNMASDWNVAPTINAHN